MKTYLCDNCVHRGICTLEHHLRSLQDSVNKVHLEDGDKGCVIDLDQLDWIDPIQIRCKHFCVVYRYRGYKDASIR